MKKGKEKVVCVVILVCIQNYIYAYVFIDTQNISGNIFKKLLRAVVIREDSWWLGHGEEVRGGLLFTIKNFVTIQSCAMYIHCLLK